MHFSTLTQALTVTVLAYAPLIAGYNDYGTSLAERFIGGSANAAAHYIAQIRDYQEHKREEVEAREINEIIARQPLKARRPQRGGGGGRAGGAGRAKAGGNTAVGNAGNANAANTGNTNAAKSGKAGKAGKGGNQAASQQAATQQAASQQAATQQAAAQQAAANTTAAACTRRLRARFPHKKQKAAAACARGVGMADLLE
ncbi:hypothetical protein BU16DRAFT_527656 [Lophium mytilinum]|uniref:Uncharacterized protein n=1 Tax=Lophium mytilinum TaxID=390894 RepID=A0A6A6QR41_9PEZI|nr:hypothetical protein BU16DRAFT_527656 [Lophium mytilinum]